MQAKSVLAALFAITSASSAFAQSAPATKTASESHVTRQQVMDEFYAARKAGQIPQTEADFDVAQTRHQVAR